MAVFLWMCCYCRRSRLLREIIDGVDSARGQTRADRERLRVTIISSYLIKKYHIFKLTYRLCEANVTNAQNYFYIYIEMLRYTANFD